MRLLAASRRGRWWRVRSKLVGCDGSAYHINFAADDPAARSRLDAFLAGLQSLGWIDGRNVHIDIRWGAGDVNKVQFYAAELVSLRPDVIFADGVTSVTALQRETTSVPIVFVQLADPVCT